jgi:hypothetical protein
LGRDGSEKAYAKFILDYAALEDTIRALWMEIKKEEETLIVCCGQPVHTYSENHLYAHFTSIASQEIAKKRRIVNDAVRTTMETTGYAALGQIKESCHGSFVPFPPVSDLIIRSSRAAGRRYADASGRLNPVAVNHALAYIAYITPVLPSLSRYFQLRTVKL